MSKKDQYLDHLAAVPMFSACSKKDLQLVAKTADEFTVNQGANLTVEGGSGREFFVIVEGKAKVTREGKQIAVLGAGDFFGELSLLDKAPRNATVTASTPLDVLVLEQRSFTALLAEVPSIARKLMIGMARRLNQLDSKA
ncbi:MAG: cyclic nucleotide-binding domain-containing protein [Acidimicrobiales bacterium]